MSHQTVRSAVVPKTTTFDKFAAVYLYIVYVLKRELEESLVYFEGDEGIPDDAYDVDVRVKYTQEKDERGRQLFGSATHRMVIRNSLGHLPGMMQIVGLLNLNNTNGCLKDDRWSLVGLMRALPSVGHNVSFREHRLNILRLYWPLLDSYFDACSINLGAVEEIENPFTLEGYRHLMGIQGLSDTEIFERCRPFEREFGKSVVRKGQAIQRAQTAQAREFPVTSHSGLELTGHLIESDDERIAGPYFREHQSIAMLVVRKSSGHYAIFVRGPQSLTTLYEILDGVEPELWYHNDRPKNRGGSPNLLNGSGSRLGKAPSGLKPAQLIEIIQRHYRHLTRKERDGGRRRDQRRQSRATANV